MENEIECQSCRHFALEHSPEGCDTIGMHGLKCECPKTQSDVFTDHINTLSARQREAIKVLEEGHANAMNAECDAETLAFHSTTILRALAILKGE